MPSWADAERVCLDVETRDEQLKVLGPGVRRGGYVVGISVGLQPKGACAAESRSWYLPIRQQGGDNLPEEAVWAYLRREAAAFRGDVCGANLQYDLDYLWENGVDTSACRWYRDIQVADPLICELHFSYGLEEVAGRWGFEGKNEGHLRRAARRWGLDPKKDLWKLPARHVGAYAEADTLLPLRVLERQERKIREGGLQQIYDLESRVLPVLCRMRRRGVRIDFDALDRVEKWTTEEETRCLSEVKRLTGVEIPVADIWAADLVLKALLATGWKPTKMTPTGQVCLDKEVMETVEGPVAEMIQRARKVDKIRTTFAQSVRDYQTNGRIHCTFNQLRYQREDGDEGGAAFGRLSCVDINLQQQPARDEELGPLWRSIYVPDPGKRWCAADYSAQEPRWAVHYAARIGAPGAAEMLERFRREPRTDLHQQTADLAGIKRKEAKTIFLGLAYGMGGAKLCRSLGFPVLTKSSKELGWTGPERVVQVAGPEGAAFLDKFRSLVPFLSHLAKSASRRAEQVGEVVTAGGRHCRFPRKGAGYDWTHKALNRIIQGSSADQTKSALVALDAAGIPVQLQVHDEIDLSCETEAEGRAVEEVMRTCLPCDVPVVVDLEWGPSWGASMGCKVFDGNGTK